MKIIVGNVKGKKKTLEMSIIKMLVFSHWEKQYRVWLNSLGISIMERRNIERVAMTSNDY